MHLHISARTKRRQGLLADAVRNRRLVTANILSTLIVLALFCQMEPTGAQLPSASQPAQITQLARTGELVFHWMNLQGFSPQSQAPETYEVYLFFPPPFDVGAAESQWYAAGGGFCIAASGAAVLAPDGQVVSDPLLIGQVLERALNTCDLKLAQPLNLRLDPQEISRVFGDRDSNLMILYERFVDVITHPTESETDRAFHSAFMTILPPLAQNAVKSASILTSLPLAAEKAISSREVDVLNQTIGLEVQEQGILGLCRRKLGQVDFGGRCAVLAAAVAVGEIEVGRRQAGICPRCGRGNPLGLPEPITRDRESGIDRCGRTHWR